jgi:hypothetical protein
MISDESTSTLFFDEKQHEINIIINYYIIMLWKIIMRKQCTQAKCCNIPAQPAPIAYNYDQLNHIHQCIHHLESKKDCL